MPSNNRTRIRSCARKVCDSCVTPIIGAYGFFGVGHWQRGTLMANGTHRARGQFVAVQMFRLFASFHDNKDRVFRILMAEFDDNAINSIALLS